MRTFMYTLALATAAQATPLSLGQSITTFDVTRSPPARSALLAPRAPQVFIQEPSDTRKCTESNFANQTTEFSATIEDCVCITETLRDSSGDWSGKFLVRPSDGSEFGVAAVTCRSCSFVVQSDSQFGTNVGTDDVVDLITEAVERFVRAGGEKLGASGETVCENDSGQDGVDEFSKTTWLIAHVPN